MTNIKNLEIIANDARIKMIDALIEAGMGHPGGAFSSVDVMVALYFEIMNIDPKNPKSKERDYFILSKGHSSIALYSVLSLRGFFDNDVLMTFRQDGSILGGHPDMHKVPGIEMCTGSLGHGLSVGVGIALNGKMERKDYKTYVLMGDGETQEGSIWEAAMSASHYKLDSLVGIVDRNKLQIDGFTEDIMSLEPYRSKWESFGWEVKEINGNSIKEIVDAFKKIPFETDKPSLIISNTIKGKGIPFMENKVEWHGKPIKEEYIELARDAAKKLMEKHEQ